MNINKLSKRKSEQSFNKNSKDIISFLKKRIDIKEVENFLVHSLCHLAEEHKKKTKKDSEIILIQTDYSLILQPNNLVSEIQDICIDEELMYNFLEKINYEVDELSKLLISFAQTKNENIEKYHYYKKTDNVFKIMVLIK